MLDSSLAGVLVVNTWACYIIQSLCIASGISGFEINK
jgi:hypothetical protein